MHWRGNPWAHSRAAPPHPAGLQRGKEWSGRPTVRHSALATSTQLHSPRPMKTTVKKYKGRNPFHRRMEKEPATDKTFQQLLQGQKAKLSQRRVWGEANPPTTHHTTSHACLHLQALATTETGARHRTEGRAESLIRAVGAPGFPAQPSVHPRDGTFQSHSSPNTGDLF